MAIGFMFLLAKQLHANPCPPDTINFYKGWANRTFSELQTMREPASHLWKRAGWWNCANIFEASLDHHGLTAEEVNDIYKANKFKFRRGFKNRAYDDNMWWAISWLKAYDQFHNKEYLATAENIWKDVNNTWDDKCGGGVRWQMYIHYKNAITNELFMVLSARLAQHSQNKQKAFYTLMAERSWHWFKNSGMINDQYLVNDGLDDNCKNNHGTTWTYNQGVILGGLINLFELTNDSSYLTQAEKMASASIKALSDSNGILTEPCGGNCNGDAVQFKGIYIRYLALMPYFSVDGEIHDFIRTNAHAAWSQSHDNQYHFDIPWQGPYKDWSGAAQGAALDLMNAAEKWFTD